MLGMLTACCAVRIISQDNARSVYCVFCIFCILQLCSVYCIPHTTLCAMFCILHTKYTMYTVFCAVYSVQSIKHLVQRVLYSAHFILYSI